MHYSKGLITNKWEILLERKIHFSFGNTVETSFFDIFRSLEWITIKKITSKCLQTNHKRKSCSKLVKGNPHWVIVYNVGWNAHQVFDYISYILVYLKNNLTFQKTNSLWTYTIKIILCRITSRGFQLSPEVQTSYRRRFR